MYMYHVRKEHRPVHMYIMVLVLFPVSTCSSKTKAEERKSDFVGLSQSENRDCVLMEREQPAIYIYIHSPRSMLSRVVSSCPKTQPI